MSDHTKALQAPKADDYKTLVRQLRGLCQADNDVAFLPFVEFGDQSRSLDDILTLCLKQAGMTREQLTQKKGLFLFTTRIEHAHLFFELEYFH